MRKTALCWAISLFILAVTTGSLSAQTTWLVSAPAGLDARVSSEVSSLARRHGARVERAPEGKPAPAVVARGVLSLELKQAESLDSFRQELVKLANNPRLVPTDEQAREGYIIHAISESPGRIERIQITAGSPPGLHYGLLRAEQIVGHPKDNNPEALAPTTKFRAVTTSGKTTVLTMADFPSFPERGIVEGFYGKPWSPAERLEMIRFEGAHRMNVYYYAPKDDPYHRRLWRKPYPPAAMRRLAQLIQAAHDNFVDFCFAISPGLSMTYSSEDDFNDLTKKLESVQGLGVSCFALFLDDVPQELQWPADRARYKTLAEAHVDVINRLYHALQAQSPRNRLVVTPTVYTNEWGSQDYVRELGAGVDPHVAIVWTGPKVASPEITVAQARAWGQMLHRKPLVWDNFPVNDGKSWRLHLGPVVNRDADLPEAVAGLFSNPMIQPVASRIPLATVAEYLWNSPDFHPQEALQRAVTEQYGTEGMRILRPFLTTYGDYWWDENIFEPLYEERREPIDVGKIEARLRELSSNVSTLKRQPRFRRLTAEFAPFPVRTRKRLAEVLDDPAFQPLPGGRIQLRKDFDVLHATRVPDQGFVLDGDFAKWEGKTVYRLDARDQITRGHRRWRGAQQFSARFALGWNENTLFLAFDVTNPNLYQPAAGRGIDNGDAVAIYLETAFRKNYLSTEATGDEYHLFFSPGDFAGVPASVYSSEDYLPPRPVKHDYAREIQSAWRKTAQGYSGEVALPASWFEGGRFKPGYEIGLSVSAQKVFPKAGANALEAEDFPRVIFRSKQDRTFSVHVGNPQSYQKLVLEGPRSTP